MDIVNRTRIIEKHPAFRTYIDDFSRRLSLLEKSVPEERKNKEAEIKLEKDMAV